MAAKFQAPRGTFDVLPADAVARDELCAAASSAFERAGYGRIEVPAFEDTELFTRGIGEATDIVRKEMFTFEDLGGRSLTLRPEATASICRAYVEHGMHTLPQPVKLWCYGPFFRHERPQAGRYRQFWQLDIEAIGSDSPLVDVEQIILLDELLRGLGVEGVELRLSSLGSAATRAEYRTQLQDYLRANEPELSAEVRERIDANPLRAFDSDHEGTRAVMAEAPTMLERLSPEDAEHFAEVRRLLDQSGVDYKLDGTLVRGLDYYTRTVFEFDCERLGAQSGLGGGGRYDGLVEQLGGPSSPACGWAAGVERILLALDTQHEQRGVDVFIVADEGSRDRALALAVELRRAQIATDLDLARRSIKGQMKQADRSGAKHAVILEGEGELQLRDMDSGEQRAVAQDGLVGELQPR